MKLKILAANDAVLASFTVNFGTASAGSISITESDLESTGLATGTPAKWQLTTSGDVTVLSDTGLTGIIIAPNSVTVGQSVVLESFTYTAPV